MNRSIVPKVVLIAAVVVISLITLSNGIDLFIGGEPRSVWVPRITFGVLVTVVNLVIIVSHNGTDGRDRTDRRVWWTFEILFVCWVSVGLGFTAVGYGGVLTPVTTFLGTIPLVILGYLKITERTGQSA